MQDKEYIAVMLQSLFKKREILDLIIEKNREQKVLFLEENSDPDRLEENMQEKSRLVDQLNQLDEGFQQLYDRIKPALLEQKDCFQQEIVNMKQLITEITEKSATIQAQEHRNRDLAVKRFASVKENIRQARTSNKVASQYYQSMSRINVGDSHFMDSKK